MTKWMLAAGVAALAIAAPAAAEPEQGRRQGRRQTRAAGRPRPSAAAARPGRSKAERGEAAKARRAGRAPRPRAGRARQGRPRRQSRQARPPKLDRGDDRRTAKIRPQGPRPIVRDRRRRRRRGFVRRCATATAFAPLGMAQRLPAGPRQEEQRLHASGPGEEAGRPVAPGRLSRQPAAARPARPLSRQRRLLLPLRRRLPLPRRPPRQPDRVAAAAVRRRPDARPAVPVGVQQLLRAEPLPGLLSRHVATIITATPTAMCTRSTATPA